MIKTDKVNVYVHTRYGAVTPQEIASLSSADQETIDNIVPRLTFTSANFSEDGNWIPVGTADVIFHPIGIDEMVLGQIESLENQVKKVRAESHRTVSELQDKISKLKAIEWSGE